MTKIRTLDELQLILNDERLWRKQELAIIKSLVNEVAHGKRLSIGVAQFIELHQTIIHLLDLFSNQISNAASTRAYKRIP